MKRDLPLGLYGWCFVIFVASFMPWATSPVMFPFFGSISAIATGWTGNINFVGVVIPNWVAVILAGALVVIAWLRSNSVDIEARLPFWLALCGAGHAFFFIVSVFMRGPAQLGLGSVATLGAFVAILRLLKKSNAVSPTT